ncbi:MAG TPA: DUF4097 family beta strand repeat-containing protein [Micromonosporaceae bacterium]
MSAWKITQPERLTLDEQVTTLEVWLAHGRLRVIGTDGPARIEVTRLGRDGVEVNLADGLLAIRHALPPRGWRRFGGPFWWWFTGRHRFTADLTVAVPVTAVGALTVISGNVLVSGLRHGVTVDVTSGSITLTGLGGLVQATTTSGSIHARSVSGDLAMRTVSGEINLAESSAEHVVARTVSGSVTCDLDNPNARDVRVNTTSGEILVRLPRDVDLTVHLSATSGRVTSAFPEVRPSGTPGQRSAFGRLGSGAGTLHAAAVSGSVSLLAAPAHVDRDQP